MAIVFKQFNSAQELVDYLNDIVLTKNLPMKVMGLAGLTLILTAGTVTFVDATGEGLTLVQIVTQINAVVADAVALRNYGHMQSPPQGQVALIKAAQVIDKDGTANSLLGLSTAADVTIGANAVAKTDIAQITSDANGSRFSVFHE